MFVFNRLDIMLKYKPKMLWQQRLDDQITCLNLSYPNRTFYVSKKWYQKASEHGYLDDCCFNIVVSNFMFNPSKPILL